VLLSDVGARPPADARLVEISQAQGLVDVEVGIAIVRGT